MLYSFTFYTLTASSLNAYDHALVEAGKIVVGMTPTIDRVP